ncbi:MAG: hypothetical protein ABIF09_19225 [Gemmatimonadota bacterium]
MSRFYRRTKPGLGENLRAGLVAGALAGTVAAVSFYLVRLFLAREPLEPLPTSPSRKEPAGRTNEIEA